MDEITPGWRYVHIGVEGDGVAVDGARLWETAWEASIGVIVAAHPSYSWQRHEMRVYRVLVGNRAITFAAGEVSNGVWAFFEPAGT